jgi:hypothetical protein
MDKKIADIETKFADAIQTQGGAMTAVSDELKAYIAQCGNDMGFLTAQQDSDRENAADVEAGMKALATKIDGLQTGVDAKIDTLESEFKRAKTSGNTAQIVAEFDQFKKDVMTAAATNAHSMDVRITALEPPPPAVLTQAMKDLIANYMATEIAEAMKGLQATTTPAPDDPVNFLGFATLPEDSMQYGDTGRPAARGP